MYTTAQMLPLLTHLDTCSVNYYVLLLIRTCPWYN